MKNESSPKISSTKPEDNLNLNLNLNQAQTATRQMKPKGSPIRKTDISQHNEDKFNSNNMTQGSSLVKYDTPFLVSTTVSNKKKLEELDENKESVEKFFRTLINQRASDGEKTEYEDYSVKDALNKILPPKKIMRNDQLWVQYVSCTPVTKVEVDNLKKGLERRLQSMQAKETGICPKREELYNECFDELIRQVTINCLERGIVLMRTKKEIEMTIAAYQALYQSSIAYGIRTSLMNEEYKRKKTEQVKNIEEECESLRAQIKKLEEEIEEKKVK